MFCFILFTSHNSFQFLFLLLLSNDRDSLVISCACFCFFLRTKKRICVIQTKMNSIICSSFIILTPFACFIFLSCYLLLLYFIYFWVHFKLFLWVSFSSFKPMIFDFTFIYFVLFLIFPVFFFFFVAGASWEFNGMTFSVGLVKWFVWVCDWMFMCVFVCVWCKQLLHTSGCFSVTLRDSYVFNKTNLLFDVSIHFG